MDNFHPDESSASGQSARTDESFAEICAIWEHLQQQLQNKDHLRRAHALLKANDHLFQSFVCIRTDPDDQFREALHLSIVQFAPQDDAFELILTLRYHPAWPSFRHLIIPQLENLGPAKLSTNSFASQGSYTRSSGHHSLASARSYPNTNSNYSVTEATAETRGEGDNSNMNRFHASRGPSTTTESGKKRMAPEGQQFICPWPQCYGKTAWVKVGHWDNHHALRHPGEPRPNPYHHLQRKFDVNTKIPAKMESASDSATIPPESPRNTFAEVDTINDVPASGHEYHLTLQQLSGAHSPMMHDTNYFGGTGVGIVQGYSYFNHD